jgi:hypothetical protein
MAKPDENASPRLQKQYALERVHAQQLRRLAKTKVESAKTQARDESGAKAKGGK